METTTIHPAEAYLRNADTPPSLYVRIDGERRRLFTNRDDSIIGIVTGKTEKKLYFHQLEYDPYQTPKVKYNVST